MESIYTLPLDHFIFNNINPDSNGSFVITGKWYQPFKQATNDQKNAETPFCGSDHVTKKKPLFLLAQPVCIKEQARPQNFINLCINKGILFITGLCMVDKR